MEALPQGDMVRGPKQVEMLKSESVSFKGQKVDMHRHRWWPALF